MAGQEARPTGRRTGMLRKYIHLRPSRCRFRFHQNHGFKRIRTFQRFRANQFRTEIGRTAYILSSFWFSNVVIQRSCYEKTNYRSHDDSNDDCRSGDGKQHGKSGIWKPSVPHAGRCADVVGGTIAAGNERHWGGCCSLGSRWYRRRHMGRCRLYAWGVYQGHYKWDNAKFADNVATGAVIDASLVLRGQLPVEESNLFPAWQMQEQTYGE